MLCFRFGLPTVSSLAQYNVSVGDKLKLEQQALDRNSKIVDLTSEVTALRTQLHQAAKSRSASLQHYKFKGEPVKITSNAFATDSLLLKRATAAVAVEPSHLFRVEHLATGNQEDYFILAVGWIVLSARNDKHFTVWAMRKDAASETWGVCLFGFVLYMCVLTRGCVQTILSCM